jgi:hypothetical protein
MYRLALLDPVEFRIIEAYTLEVLKGIRLASP